MLGSDLNLCQQLVVDSKSDKFLELWHVIEVLACDSLLDLAHVPLKLRRVLFVVLQEGLLVPV